MFAATLTIVAIIDIVASSAISHMKIPTLSKRDCNLQKSVSTSAPPTSCLGPGIISTCNRWDTVVSGNICPDYTYHGITEDNLKAWNAINPGCTNLQPNTWICTGVNNSPCPYTCPAGSTITPGVGMVAPGTTVPCTCYYLVQTGDFCDSVSAKFGITSTQLEQWNLSAGGASCPTLPANKYICVAVPHT